MRPVQRLFDYAFSGGIGAASRANMECRNPCYFILTKNHTRLRNIARLFMSPDARFISLIYTFSRNVSKGRATLRDLCLVGRQSEAEKHSSLAFNSIPTKGAQRCATFSF
jgi:hypothetical protein